MKLEIERKKINKIDKKMVKLFNKRLDSVKKIGIYKKENNLNILDLKREEEVINNNLKYVNKEYTELYMLYIKNIMDISKKIE